VKNVKDTLREIFARFWVLNVHSDWLTEMITEAESKRTAL